ncbi:MAG: hypothetical protein E3J25_06675 [Anaerolineales bacterium]|nr:MAG: hypothetical protein E3J25_06675 [Anaerolineales bacterium]
MTMLETLQAKKPERDVLFTAIDNLTTANDIKQFYNEYLAARGEDWPIQTLVMPLATIAGTRCGAGLMRCLMFLTLSLVILWILQPKRHLRRVWSWVKK